MAHGASIESLQDALSALGEAWRGDWSEFDGRTLRSQLNTWLDLHRKAMADEDVRPAVHGMVEIEWGICRRCRSWREHCRCD